MQAISRLSSKPSWKTKKGLLYIENPPGFINELKELGGMEELDMGEDMGMGDMDFMNMILGSVNYKSEIIFPSKIKSSTTQTA